MYGLVQKKVVLGGVDCMKAKSAALFVFKATGFMSEIYLKTDERLANGKSLLSVIAMMLKNGDEVTVMTEGADEELALDAMCNFLTCVTDD